MEVQESQQLQNGVLCVMCRVDRSDGRLGVVKNETGGQSTNMDGEREVRRITVDPGPR